ncbi:hypothetical protein Trydic_g9235 [Trypoxylus dichotomus]
MNRYQIPWMVNGIECYRVVQKNQCRHQALIQCRQYVIRHTDQCGRKLDWEEASSRLHTVSSASSKYAPVPLREEIGLKSLTYSNKCSVTYNP